MLQDRHRPTAQAISTSARRPDSVVYCAIMHLSAPKQSTWLVALALGVLGVLLHYGVVHVGLLAPYTFLLVVGGLALLLVASISKGL